jgi:hypothetical protein
VALGDYAAVGYNDRKTGNGMMSDGDGDGDERRATKLAARPTVGGV